MLPGPDIFVAVGTLVFLVFLLPTLLDKNAHVPRLTSVAFAFAATSVAVGLLMAGGLWLGAAVNLADAVGWALVCAVRGRRRPLA